MGSLIRAGFISHHVQLRQTALPPTALKPTHCSLVGAIRKSPWFPAPAPLQQAANNIEPPLKTSTNHLASTVAVPQFFSGLSSESAAAFRPHISYFIGRLRSDSGKCEQKGNSKHNHHDNQSSTILKALLLQKVLNLFLFP